MTSNAQVDAKANGTVRVTVRAYTLAAGTRSARPIPIEVKATQAGTIGWLIAIAAGIVLIGGSALRIRQVAKERAASRRGRHETGGDGTRLAAGAASSPTRRRSYRRRRRPTATPPPRDPESLDV